MALQGPSNVQQMNKQNNYPQRNAQQSCMRGDCDNSMQQRSRQEGLTQASTQQTMRMNIYPQMNARQVAITQRINKDDHIRNILGINRQDKDSKKKIENTIKRMLR